MERPLTLATLAFFGLAQAGLACSCFGPQTFCGTLNPQPPQFPEPQWWIPDAIVLVVKLADVEYGVDVKVVQSFSGELASDTVIRVWGDCGLLCRHYVNGPAIGDTLLWALKHTDLMGNGLCGTSFEEPQDWALSICGVYWLGYGNGVVSGPITEEGATESVTLEEFQQVVNGCLSTGLDEQTRETEFRVVYDDGVPILSCSSLIGSAELTVLDAHGRAILRRRWSGASLPFDNAPPGIYVARITTASGDRVQKIRVGR